MQQETNMSIPSHEQLEFQLFESEQVDEIKKDHPEYNQKEVASEVKIRWKALEDNEKKIYQEMLDKPSQSDTQYDEEPLFLTNGDKRMKLTIDEEKQNQSAISEKSKLNNNQFNSSSNSRFGSNLFESKAQTIGGNLFGQQIESLHEKQEPYQFNKLHQIMKDIHSIIESNTLNKEEKEIKLIKIFNEMKKKDNNELIKIFNIDAYKLFQSYINNCNAEIEKILLDIIDQIAQRGMQEWGSNYFFDYFQQSGFINKIEKMIKEKFDEKQNLNVPFSEITEQLMRIYKRIGDCSSESEKIILNIIELLSEKGNQYYNNQFFDSFQQSGLIIKIEQLLQQKIEQEEKENDNIPFSQIIEQLMRIYLNIMNEYQIDYEMKERILQIINKSNSNIFGSNLLSEQEKESKAQQLIEQMKNKRINKLIKIFDIWTLNIMKIRIGNCSSEYEKILLNIIELLSEKGKYNNNNQFFDSFQQSGLIIKIEQLLQQKIEQEEKENDNIPFSQIIEQLMRIYINIMKGKQINDEMKERILQIINKSNSNIFGSSTLPEQEKEQKAITLLEQMKNKEINELMNIFDSWMIDIIMKRIGNCSSESEKIIVNIIELLSEKGIQQNNNLFFDDFVKSRLLVKIERLIIERMEQEEKENELIPFSEVLEQLMRIYQNIMKEQQIDDEMKERIIKITNKCNCNILGSCTLSDNEKEIKAKGLFEEIKNKEINELIKIFDSWMIDILMKRIGNSSSESEKTILNIIELLSEKGNQYYNNQFFDSFQQSGLIIKIEQLLQQKIEQEEKENDNIPFSQIIEQLMRIYINIMKGKQINDEMKERILQIINKSNSNIFGSSTLPEQEKEQKAITLLEQMKNKEINELMNIFDIWNIKLLITRIGNCSSVSEKILLQIIELLSEKGIQQNNNQFFNIFEQSGLTTNIEILIIEKLEQEEKEKDNIPFSEVLEQLMRIYLINKNGQQIDTEFTDKYVKILKRNINFILDNLSDDIENQEEKDRNEINNEQTEYNLKRVAQSIHQANKIRNYDQINKFFKEEISQLMHINCTCEIICPLNITVNNSPGIQQLQNVLFQSLFDISKVDNQFKEHLLKEDSFLQHLTPLIINFANNNSHQQQQNKDQQQSHIFPSLSIIKSSLFLIENLFIANSLYCQIVTSSQKLIPSLIKLYKYKLSDQFNHEESANISSIRFCSDFCLGRIQLYGNASIQAQLSDEGYARTLINYLSADYQIIEQLGNNRIRNALIGIFYFIKQLQLLKKTNYLNPQRLIIQLYSNLLYSAYEQIEEEGGNEEIEAQLVNKGGTDKGSVKDEAKDTKNIIMNFYHNKIN